MSWGSSWSKNEWGNGWGASGVSISRESSKNGQHRSTCTAGIGMWGGNSYRYDDSCPGCRQDRAIGRANTNKGSAAITLVSMFTGAKVAKNSLWG